MKKIQFAIHDRPVSINRAYATIRGRRVLTQDGKNFKKSCWVEAQNAARANGIKDKFKYPISLKIDLYLDSVKRSDVDNYIKLIQDGFEDIFWKDDREIKRVQAEKHFDKNVQKIVITIEQL